MKIFSIFSIFAMFFLLDGVDARACEDDWKSLNGACLKVVKASVTEPEAHEACHQLGARMMSIHSQTEQDAVLRLLEEVDPSDQYHYWIGLKLTRPANGGLISCAWTDGSAFDYGDCKEKSGKAPWVAGANQEPNDARDNEICVNIGNKGWIDDKCDLKDGYICKK